MQDTVIFFFFFFFFFFAVVVFCLFFFFCLFVFCFFFVVVVVVVSELNVFLTVTYNFACFVLTLYRSVGQICTKNLQTYPENRFSTSEAEKTHNVTKGQF